MGVRGSALPGAGGSVRRCRVLQLRMHWLRTCLRLCRKHSSSLFLPGGTQTRGNNILIWAGVKALHGSTGSSSVRAWSAGKTPQEYRCFPPKP